LIEAIYSWLVDLGATLQENFRLRDLLDIFLMACAVYWVLLLVRGTRAAQMTLGLLILVLVWLLSRQLELATLGFILDNFLEGIVLIVIVIFQADIRRALTRVGRGLFTSAPRQEAHAIEEVVRASQALAQRRVGALVVIERDVGLDEYMDLGTPIDGELTRDLLVALFLPYSPLHDGAVVIREGRIASAGCILPLALRSNLPSTLGTRHRAALGVADETDAIAIVVSEETGKISLVTGEEISADLEGPRLREELLALTGNVRSEPADGATDDGGVERVRVPLGSETR
jgi:diadenylate cyclase